MSLELKINEQIKVAMLGKQEAALRALRAIKSAILLAKTSEGASAEMSQDDEIKLLQKLVKSRKDSLEIFTTQNRPELAAKEQEEIAVIEQYLPQQLTESELHTAIKEIITQMGATTMAEMGKVIAAANKSLAGKAEGKAISLMVKTLLS
jgi:uncharacterized protein